MKVLISHIKMEEGRISREEYRGRISAYRYTVIGEGRIKVKRENRKTIRHII
jgi:hypothetical protein